MKTDFEWLIILLFIILAFLFGVAAGNRTGEIVEKERFQKELEAKGLGSYVVNGNKFDFVLNVDKENKNDNK